MDIRDVPRSWASEVTVDGANLAPASVGTTELEPDAVTNTILANMTRGTIKVGGTSNAPTDRDFKASGQIPIGDGTDILPKAISGDATLAASGALTIANGVLDGSNAASLAANATTPGLLVLFRTAIPDDVTGDVDIVVVPKVRVVDAWVVKTGGAGNAGNSYQLKNGATAITDAIDGDLADTAIKRAGTIDDAQHVIAAAGTLRWTRTKAGGNAQAVAYTLCTIEP